MSVIKQKATQITQDKLQKQLKTQFSNKDLAAMVGEKVIGIKKCMHADGYTEKKVQLHLMNLIKVNFYKDPFTMTVPPSINKKLLATKNTFQEVIEFLIRDHEESRRKNLYRILELFQIEYETIKINRKEDAFSTIQKTLESSANNSKKQSSSVKRNRSPLKQNQHKVTAIKEDQIKIIDMPGLFGPSMFKPNLFQTFLQLTREQSNSGADFAALSQTLMKAEMLKEFLQEKMALAEICRKKLDILKRAEEETNDRDSCNEYQQLEQ